MLNCSEENAMVWTLVDLPNGKRAIGTKWVFRNKTDERGIVVRNKARLVAQENRFRRGTIDKTLFIKKDKGDILLVQVYVDDIIFGSTKKSLCNEFEQMMHKRLQMSSMGELTFFLGLQVKQKDDGIFISQDKYVADILKKFDFTIVKTASTPMKPNKTLIKDAEAEDVDVHLYRSMIRSMMYLTASRPDIMFAVVLVQGSKLLQRLHIFMLDYAEASLNRKSTIGGCQFLDKRLISWQCKKQTIYANSTAEAEYVAAANCFGQVLWIQNQMLDYSIEFGVTTGYCRLNAARQDLMLLSKKFVDLHNMVACLERTDGNAEFHQIVDFLTSSMIHYALTDDKVVKAATTAASLVVEQESGNINKTQPRTTLNEPSPRGTSSGSGPKRHFTSLRDTYAQTRFETASKQSHDPPLSKVNTSGSGEDSMEHQDDLTDFVPPTPHDSPLSGGHTLGSDEGRPNINELMNICSKLSNRVLALEQFKTAQDLVIKRTKELNLSDKGSCKTKVFDSTTAAEKDVNATKPVSTATDTINAASVIPDVSAAGPSTSTVEDIFEDEMTTMVDTLMAIRRTRPRTTSAQIQRDAEIAQRLFEEEQARFEREQRTAKEKAAEQEAKDAALIEQIEDVQARIDADALLAERLQQKEREQFTVDDKQEAKSSKKRSRVDHDKESVKKQKLEDNDAEKEELKACLDIVPVDDITINVESLATKYPIVDWKTHTLTEHMMYYQIIRANGSFKNYKILTKMCDDFDRQDITDLYRLVKEMYETTSPEGYDLLLWGDLITLFELSEEDIIWKAQQDYNLIS
nr:putative ribonuclease H-like domain-containing protein [Tanacetum cinerariifolium]